MDGKSTTQVFQTNSASRWQRFKWSSRLVFLLIVLGIVTIVITLSRVYTPALPNLISVQEKQALFDSSGSWLFNKSKIGKQYGGFRKFINEKEAYKAGGYPISKRFRKQNGVIVQADSSFYSFKKFSAGIRAAFYVNWDPKSFSSLEQNIARLNMVVPEWFFINPNADTLETNIDTKALDIMNKAGVKVLPLLTNNYKEVFRGDVVHRILTDRKKRTRFINDIIHTIQKYNFDGVNIILEQRRCLAAARRQAGKHRLVLRIFAGLVVGLCGGGTLAVRAAHFFAQVGRLHADGLQRLHGAERRRQP